MKTILITGASGAGASGIGSALVKACDEKAYQIIGVDAKEPTGETEKILSGASHRFIKADISDAFKVQALFRVLHQEDIKITHVISNAGQALAPEFESDIIDETIWDATIGINLSSHYYIVKNALSLFSSEKNKSITLMSSINALQGYGLTGYSAAKAGLVGMMNALAPYLGEKGIRINTLMPGTVVSPNESEDKDYELLKSQSCMNAMAHPADVAEAALHMINMPHLTGAQIVLDGGQSIYRRQK